MLLETLAQSNAHESGQAALYGQQSPGRVEMARSMTAAVVSRDVLELNIVVRMVLSEAETGTCRQEHESDFRWNPNYALPAAHDFLRL